MIHLDTECACNPTVIPVECPDGSIGWVTAHREEDQTPEQEAQRAEMIFRAMDEIRQES